MTSRIVLVSETCLPFFVCLQEIDKKQAFLAQVLSLLLLFKHDPTFKLTVHVLDDSFNLSKRNFCHVFFSKESRKICICRKCLNFTEDKVFSEACLNVFLNYHSYAVTNFIEMKQVSSKMTWPKHTLFQYKNKNN